jgi:hypothetical protein
MRRRPPGRLYYGILVGTSALIVAIVLAQGTQALILLVIIPIYLAIACAAEWVWRRRFPDSYQPPWRRLRSSAT